MLRIIILSAFIVANCAHADDQKIDSVIDNGEIGVKDDSRIESWVEFGISEREWRRYLQIKSGPLGFKQPNIEPLLALAMYSSTDEDANRYLELYAIQQKFIWDRGKEIEQLYRKAYQRLHPGELPIEQDQVYVDKNTIRPTDRFLVIVRIECGKCAQSVKTFVNRMKMFPRNGIDIYVHGATSNDDIVSWAKSAFDDKEFERRDITLNPGSHYLNHVIDGKDMTAVVLRDDSVISIESIEALL